MKAPPLSDTVFAKLEQEIREGRFSPGDKLPTEKELSEREGVSRTVVREAVARLAAQGLAQARHGSGLYVSEMATFPAFQIRPDELSKTRDVIKLLELRSAIESEMASLAALRRTNEDLDNLKSHLHAIEQSVSAASAIEADAAFHRSISRASKNDYFERFLDFLGARLVPPRSLLLAGRPPEAHQAYATVLAREHGEIFDAIANQDPTRAHAAARRHMQDSIDRHTSLSLYRSSPGQA